MKKEKKRNPPPPTQNAGEGRPSGVVPAVLRASPWWMRRLGGSVPFLSSLPAVPLALPVPCRGRPLRRCPVLGVVFVGRPRCPHPLVFPVPAAAVGAPVLVDVVVVVVASSPSPAVAFPGAGVLSSVRSRVPPRTPLPPCEQLLAAAVVGAGSHLSSCLRRPGLPGFRCQKVC
jgi:hypothetical protein